MHYGTGEQIRMWDRIEPWVGCRGFVVASPDTDEYSGRFPRKDWSFLGRGILLDTSVAGLIHYTEPDAELRLASRGGPPEPEEWAILRREQFSRPNSEWNSGVGPTVQIGFLNRNKQICTGHRGKAGSDHLQLAYRVECGLCGDVYGANGSDIHDRLCPNCQGGAPGLEY